MEAEDKLAEALEAAEDQKTDEERQAEEDRVKEMAADGKALKTALGLTPLANLDADEANAPSLNSVGLMLTAADGIDEDMEVDPTPRMLTGDSAGMLGDWEGTNYSHTHVITGFPTPPSCTRTRASRQ